MTTNKPLQRTVKADRNPHIKLQQPFITNNQQKRNRINSGQHKINKIDVLKGQIKDMKNRVVNSKLVLMLSRKQESSPKKLVSSDHLGVVFDHETSRKLAEKVKINLSRVYQREDQTDRYQDAEGGIQIPLHLTSSFEQKNYRSIQNDVQHFKSSRYEADQTQKYNSSRPQQKIHTQRKPIIQPIRRQLFKLEDYKPKDLLKREKNIDLLKERQVQKMNRSLQNIKKKSNTQEKYLLNQSLQKLSIYLNKERNNTSKEKNKFPFKKPDQKIKIRLNKPTCGKSISGKQLLRPRYQFQIPTIKIDENQTQNHKKQQTYQINDWQELKKQVNKYQFVRKYLTQTDIFAIYQHLKKNKIRQQKWPLFVVDQASKKMKVGLFK